LNKKEIEIVLKKGKKYSSINFLLFYFPFNELKVSPIVSKKVSKKAVIRNRIKRRVRNIAKELLKKGGYAIVVKNDISNTDFQDLKYEFKKLINKIS
ncbi:MAG TPA: ribonuclease P protein component, partial [Nautiliaceae bacterium]|nr:ribonuclease P protein component [Nautiliaceae bacterium]